MKKLTLLFFTFLLLPQICFGITFQSKLDQQNTQTFSFTTSSNANRFLQLVCMMRSGSSITATYAGTSMTQIGTKSGDGSGTDVVYVFGILAPTTGSNSVVITENGTLTRCSAAEYDGVDQVTGWENVATGNVTGTTALSVSVTPTHSDWIVGGFWISSGSFTADGNTTVRTTLNSSGVWDSNALKTSAYALGYSANGSGGGGEIVNFGLIDVTQPATTVSGNMMRLGMGF